MHSIHDMLQRFRNNVPTSREERRRQRKQGQLQEMWWICDEKLADKDDGRHVVHMWDNSEGPLDTKKSPTTTKAQQSRSVDKLISEDIQHFLRAESRRADHLRTCRAPRLLPSRNPATLSGKSLEPSKRDPPLGSLVPDLNRGLAVDKNSTILEGVDDPLFIRQSVGSYPLVYTGSAGLRADNVPSSSQEETNEQARGVMPSTVVGIASELDVVLEKLRSSMGQDEQKLQKSLPQEQDAPSHDMPVNLGQIANDLDAKLLEFTLMARARDRAASEARAAEDAQKAAWKQSETKRIKELVSQECSTLRNGAQEPRGDNTCGPQDRMRGDLFHTEDSSDGSFVRLPNNAILRCGEGTPSSSIMHDTHPSSSPDAKPHPSKDPDVNRDLVMRQMADVIESVEARIKQIQALHVCDASSSQEEGTPEHGDELQGILANTPPADMIKEGNIETRRDSDDIAEIIDLDVKQPSSLPGNAGPSIAAMADADICRKMRDLGSIPGSPPYVGSSLKIIRPCQEDRKRTDAPHHPHTALRSAWLYGKTNLEHTGRCIRAELEVAMLCMQKRLDQGPNSRGNVSRPAEGEENGEIRIENEDDGQPKGTLVGKGLDPDDVARQELQMLADNMARSKESDKIDRELGLAGRDWDHLEYRMPLVSAVGARVHNSVTPSSPFLPVWVDHDPVHGGSLLQPPDHAHLKVGAVCIPSCNTQEVPRAFPSKSNVPPEAPIEDVQYVRQEPSAPLPNSDLKHLEAFSSSPSGVLRFGGCCVPSRGLYDTAVQAFSQEHCISEGIEGSELDIKTGFALARARKRLRDIQKARTSMLNGVNASSTDNQGAPQPVNEGHRVLNRLRRMRSRLAAGHI